MADAVTTQTLVDGDRNAVMRFTNLSDSTGEAAVIKVNVSDLSSDAKGQPCTAVRIDKISYNINGMGLNILWDATANVTAILLEGGAGSASDTVDWKPNGGIVNNAGAGVTGDVLFSTIGAAAGTSYDITLHMVKKYG
jgi:hypothetical protein